ncbi:MAG: shikimate dehydrogenase [Xanthomonadales bacterium]|nr:shikimate dehydrogenase [Gammaproteobacteria bacterium]NNE06892.1 shikimate dehydrogenase [Xanthomonadales bacterium]NNL95554.1 shikimate dehydrogenase [Xanthomonadales bacterium]
MDQDATLIRLAVFGMPVKHSLSPRIHGLFAEQAGLDIEYRAIETCEEFLAREVQALADSGGRGCNITMPLKQRAFDLANRASDRARLAGAANTLLFETPSRWKADNTDGIGLVRDLARQMDGTLAGSRIAIVGAGGAVAGVLGDLLAENPENVFIFNRTEKRARALSERFSELGKINSGTLADMENGAEFDLVINATSMTRKSDTALPDMRMLAPSSLLYDLNYGQAHESLATWAHKKNIRCIDGRGMLVEQAAQSFFLWTGFRADTGPVIEALQNPG